ncbi:class I SAM-dependent DNA methyltransferase, partial [Fusobacterium sp. PH5-44]|uniref:class I SAM-dependent DNA methyltransferase n=1 Tax=unclassified Fusobacterium TaxID=2648384 RepID=UPI003D2630EB
MYNFFPKIYDEFMESVDYGKWRELVIKATKENAVPKNSILDLGCGTGSLLLKLKEDFNDLSGIDISQNMVKVAIEKSRKEEANINFYEDDMIIFETKKKVDVIVSFFDTLNHILSEDEMLMHFTSVKKALSKGGIYVFDYVDREFMDKMFPNN